MENSVLTVKEAAEILRISASKTYQLIRENQLPHISLGHRYVVPKQRLMEWVELSVKGG